MDEEDRPDGVERTAAVAFLGGVLTTATIALAFFVFLGVRVGFATIWERIGLGSAAAVLEMPDELIAELAAIDGVVENAGNPTGAKLHDTLLVQPHGEWGYTLRPGVSVDAYQVRTAEPVNLDPPVVYVGSNAPLSPALRAWLDGNTRVSYRYDIGADGFRRTVPEVDAERSILMVGDSGLFGVGVRDEDTIASNLQRLVGDAYRVVNTGVGGYGGDAAYRVARDLAENGSYALLVYVAHSNDFSDGDIRSSPDEARRILAKFAGLRERFPGGIVVGYLPYLEQTSEDVLLSLGWKRRSRIEAALRMRQLLPAFARDAGLPLVDFADLVDEVRVKERTIFAPWSLYVDHAHLSPRGARLFAERLYARIQDAATPRPSQGVPQVELGQRDTRREADDEGVIVESRTPSR
jgi:lysophospholipase L1-like esterase